VLLVVDVGNTQTHLGVYRGEKLSQQWRASTAQTRTADELALMFGEFLALADLSFSREITGVSICSVVPRATQELRAMTLDYFGFPPVVVEPGTRTGISVMTENPREVGADRITNAVAAHALFPDEPVVVVDFGTATKVDAISADGHFLGGAIAPGIEISSNALFQVSAQIRRVELVEPATVIGRSTAACVQSGVIFGTASLVDGLVERVFAELGTTARVVATGGLAAIVVEHCRAVELVEPTLTLMGLRLVFERNASREE
jgi:type III pantothenate kinase